jgi:hypothetical protein
LINGGTGNEYFQSIAGFYVAKKHGKSLILIKSGISSQNQRNISAKSLHYNFPHGTGKLLLGTLITKILLRVGKNFRCRIIMSKLGIVISVNVNDDLNWCRELKRCWLLIGNFQSSFFFNQLTVEERVPQEIKLKERKSKRAKTVMHVRRGDYSNSTNPQGLLPLLYYAGALKQLQSNLNEKIVVVSDDPEEARELLDIAMPDFEFHFTYGDVVSDLITMVSAKNLVCANSSLSLMAGLLNDERGTVSIPKPFYESSTFDARSFPSNWIQISRGDNR